MENVGVGVIREAFIALCSRDLLTNFNKLHKERSDRVVILCQLISVPIPGGCCFIVLIQQRVFLRLQTKIIFSAGLENVIVFKKTCAEIGLFQGIPAGRGGKSGKERGFLLFQKR